MFECFNVVLSSFGRGVVPSSTTKKVKGRVKKNSDSVSNFGDNLDHMLSYSDIRFSLYFFSERDCLMFRQLRTLKGLFTERRVFLVSTGNRRKLHGKRKDNKNVYICSLK